MDKVVEEFRQCNVDSYDGSDRDNLRFFFFRARPGAREMQQEYANKVLGPIGVLRLWQYQRVIGYKTLCEDSVEVAIGLSVCETASRTMPTDVNLAAPIPGFCDGVYDAEKIEHPVLRAALHLTPLKLRRDPFVPQSIRTQILEIYARDNNVLGFVRAACALPYTLSVSDMITARVNPVVFCVPYLKIGDGAVDDGDDSGGGDDDDDETEMETEMEIAVAMRRAFFEQVPKEKVSGTLSFAPGYRLPSEGFAHKLVASGYFCIHKNIFASAEDWLSVLRVPGVDYGTVLTIWSWLQEKPVYIDASLSEDVASSLCGSVPPVLVSDEMVASLEKEAQALVLAGESGCEKPEVASVVKKDTLSRFYEILAYITDFHGEPPVVERTPDVDTRIGVLLGEAVSLATGNRGNLYDLRSDITRRRFAHK